MPGSSGGGSIAAASPSVVMPFNLCRSFHHERTWETDSNRYLNGEVQRSALTGSSGKVWVLSPHLKASDVAALRTFYLAQGGGLVEFLFYDVYETSPLFTYDPTGIATTGRHTVRFDGPWNESLVLGSMTDVQLRLQEVS